jgi:hypothetical protein
MEPVPTNVAYAVTALSSSSSTEEGQATDNDDGNNDTVSETRRSTRREDTACETRCEEDTSADVTVTDERAGGDAVVTQAVARNQKYRVHSSPSSSFSCCGFIWLLLLTVVFLVLAWVCKDNLTVKHFLIVPFLCPQQTF